MTYAVAFLVLLGIVLWGGLHICTWLLRPGGRLGLEITLPLYGGALAFFAAGVCFLLQLR